MTRAAAMAVALCFSALAPAVAADQPPTPAPAMTPSPAAAPKGEFDDSCAMGLASGQVGKDRLLGQLDGARRQGLLLLYGSLERGLPQEPRRKHPEGEGVFLGKRQLGYRSGQTVRGECPAARRGPTKGFTEDDVNKRVAEVIAERSKDGAFVFHDPKLDADLNLVFEQIKIVRGMEGYGWFANAIFHDKDVPKKQYAIDFWLKPEGDKLTLMDIRVQKGPKQDGDSYYMVTRMPVAWWWLPVQEHPGDMEVTRAWQVMGAIHDYIATHKDANGDVPIKDDKTGETIPLEFVEMHQPVRHLKKDGEYFACTDFRKPGSTDEYYDIDFWVNQKTGKLEVDNVKVHKVPVQEDGVWTQVPRYTFEGMDFDVTN